MTRDEALDVMNILRFGTFEEIINTEEIVNKALDVAIEALKDRPHGEWKYEPKLRLVDETDDGAIYETAMKCFCSACGADFGFQKVDDAFCKYCGSDNRKREWSNTKCEFANKCGISKACERGGVIKDTCPFIKKEGDENG